MQKTNYGKYWGRKDLDDSNCDKLDNLISASLYINIANEARAFLAQDISGIRENPHLRKRILRNTEKRAPRTKISASRIALIACLVATILLLSACICLPKVRESIWNTIVEWYDDHIGIHFSQNVDEENPSNEDSQVTIQISPPTSIEKRAYTSYLPNGYYAEESEGSFMFADTSYYNQNGTMQFRLVQTIISETSNDELMIDWENDSVCEQYINGHKGLLIEYPDTPGVYYLVWADAFYQYSIYGSFESKEELIRIANGINVK